MKLLKQYFELQKEIHQFFGYVEDWCVIPLDDATEYHWFLNQGENGSGHVHFSRKPLDVKLIKAGEELYGNEIYTQRFLPKWVYRTDEFTMVCVDTRTDGNKLLQIFDNCKELTNPSQEQLEAFSGWEPF
jgi:hypothetical protein